MKSCFTYKNTFCFQQENLLNSNLYGICDTVFYEKRFRNSLLCQTLYIYQYIYELSKKNLMFLLKG